MFYLYICLLVLLGLVAGFISSYLFKKFPESWLQDYDYNPEAPDFRLSKRMNYLPHGLIAGLCCAAIYSIYYIICTPPVEFKLLHMVVILLVTPVFLLVLFADHLNRIIPDQFSIYIGIVGILAIIADFVDGSYWISPEAPKYIIVLSHIIGALVGGGFLLLIEFICETFMGKMGMGMGDIKLLFAIGFLTGAYGLIFTFYIAVFAGVIIAIPKVCRKYVRIYKEHKEIKASSNPTKTKREIQLRKQKLHYADDPDYIAFGPFLAIGGAVFLAVEPLLYNKFVFVFEAFNLLF